MRFDDALKEFYPPNVVGRLLDGGARLPTQPCPPWWRPFARRRYIRQLNAEIAFASIYGWRTDLGPARARTA